MRAIDADVLLESLEESCRALRDTLEIPLSDNDRLCAKWQLVCFLENKMRVRNSPTLTLDDLRPKGRWKRDENGKVRCSVCKKKTLEAKEGVWYTPSFCPSCGADMRGGGEDG